MWLPTVDLHPVQRAHLAGAVVEEPLAGDHRPAPEVPHRHVGPGVELPESAEVLGGIGVQFGLGVDEVDTPEKVDLVVRFEDHGRVRQEAHAIRAAVVDASRGVVHETRGVESGSQGVSAHAHEFAGAFLRRGGRRSQDRRHQCHPAEHPSGGGRGALHGSLHSPSLVPQIWRSSNAMSAWKRSPSTTQPDSRMTTCMSDHTRSSSGAKLSSSVRIS